MFGRILEIQKVFSSKRAKEAEESKEKNRELILFFVRAKTEEEIQKLERWLLK
ncbi:hypothetical protein [Helicobacter pametensis]|uniref:hypothetical protein n=1 Tax=Helicobacter pametensis TaxID=95149 RepID=UPI0004B9C779|nr:hypothetical protein [Helicobacter pametensis]